MGACMTGGCMTGGCMTGGCITGGCIMGIWLNPVLGRQFVNVTSTRWAGVLVLAAGMLAFTFLYRSENFRETFRYSLQGVALFPIFFCAVRVVGFGMIA